MDLTDILKYVAVLAFVLALIGVIAWLVRKYGPGRLSAGRGRQPRLAVIDAASVDGRRKLIIIRRDNVEHLLMIGGPTDVVVETNILRAAPAAQRDAATVRAPGEQTSRIGGSPEAPIWPPHLEPAATPRTERPRLLPEESAPAPMPSTASPAPTISPPVRVNPEPMRMPEPRMLEPTRMPEPPRAQPAADPLLGLATELSRTKVEPIVRVTEPRVTIPLTPKAAVSETPGAQAAAAQVAPDVHLAEMAQRLETALRRPLAQKAEARQAAAPEQRRAERANPPTNGSAKNGPPPAKTVYEDLEQEMASLLGRQPGKT